MKKIILVIAIMVISVILSWQLYGQSSNSVGQTKEERIKKVEDEMRKLQKMAEQKEEPQEVRDFVKQSLIDIEKVKNDSLKLNRIIKNIQDNYSYLNA